VVSAPTPHLAVFGTPPRYDHLRVFGCACYPNTTATAPHSWLLVRLSVSSLGTPRITRGTAATTLPLVESSSLAMWCSMSLSSPFPPPPLPLPPRSLTSPLFFLLTWWSSHLCRCFLPVLLRSRSPVTPRGQYPTRASRGHLPDRSLRTTWVRLKPHRHASPSQCASTSNVPTTRSQTVDSSPTGTLRPAGARLPAMCPAGAPASVSTGGPLFAGVTYATGGVFHAGDTDTVVAAPSWPCRDAGVPPTASAPTHASYSP